jgi:hypothetical protein
MKISAVYAGLLIVLFITACNWDTGGSGGGSGSGNSKFFDSKLQGTWLSNDTGVYSGKLEITYNRITITGYTEGQTPDSGNDNNRPFKDFTKGAALKGYSEEGKIFIEDGGVLQEGIPYTWWENDPSPPDYKRLQFLRFTFGDRVETLQNQ